MPNRGIEAAGLAKLGMVVRLLMQIQQEIGPSSDVGQAVNKAIGELAKHVPPGANSAGVENQAMQKMMMQRRQMMPQIAALRASQAAPQPSTQQQQA